MGFSVIGTIIAAAMLLPNVLFLFFPPQNVPQGKRDAGIFFTILERVGEAGLIVLLIVSHDAFAEKAPDIWMALMIACIAVYYGLWLRYLLKGRQAALLTKPLFAFPIPMAVFPVFAFAFASVWGTSFLLLAADAVFALGHIPNCLHNAKLEK